MSLPKLVCEREAISSFPWWDRHWCLASENITFPSDGRGPLTVSVKCLHRLHPKSSINKAFPAGGRPQIRSCFLSPKANKTSLTLLLFWKRQEGPWCSGFPRVWKFFRERGWASLLLMPSRKPEIYRLMDIRIVLCLKPFLPVCRAFLGQSLWNKAQCTILLSPAGTALELLRLFWIASFFTVGFWRNPVPVWSFCHLNVSRTWASLFWTSEMFQVPQIFFLWKRKPK